MISIITPTYNEAATIAQLAREIQIALAGHSYELIVVDDDSPDQTWRVASELPEELGVRVIRRKNERGLSSAVVAGFAESRGEIIGVIDADRSHPPGLLPELLAALREGNDLVIASRLVKGGGVELWPWYRRLLSWGGRVAARPLTGVKVSMSGYFLMRREVIEGVQLVPRGYKILLEILVKGKYHRAVEIPYVFYSREIGASKMTIGTHLSYLRQLLHLYRVKFF